MNVTSVAQGWTTPLVLVDTHCHLDMEPYAGDRDAVVARAVEAGVTRMVTVGIDLESSRAAVALAEKIPGVYATVGIHPHQSGEVNPGDEDQLVRLARHPKVVAYGEIGLDTVKNYAPYDIQKKAFARQLGLARELGLPVIVHDREAHEDTHALLRAAGELPAGGIMHCFSGDVELARRFHGLGLFISIPGVVTFSKAEMLKDVVRAMPLESLLLETDGPYLAPVPWRGKRNEPAYLVQTARMVAELKGVELAAVARATTRNAARLFGWTEEVDGGPSAGTEQTP